MKDIKKPKLVTFTKWCVTEKDRTLVSVNPAEVSDVEDYCGAVEPGQLITLKNKKTYLVQGAHADVVAKLKEE
ncbi:hypothetical protein KIP88_02590 [Bradyrhizobium sp. SRL28]|uniref:hypothetical protein n=1 Tax=Bradyrhizobium sp. SRL28 TaxID=2836178 RepID=UPI001BDEFFCD|nr:hypothetical protein [Bradyrhizobium sp. SRL28]MBT1509378.1 hypothetical protein [Bradyrhizobium sp. SRL28]